MKTLILLIIVLALSASPLSANDDTVYLPENIEPTPKPSPSALVAETPAPTIHEDESSSVATPAPTPFDCVEDMACWDCETMGNRQCAPTARAGAIALPDTATEAPVATPLLVTFLALLVAYSLTQLLITGLLAHGRR